MSIGLLFWIVYIVCILFNLWVYRGPEGKYNYLALGGGIAIWLLIGLLGYHAFGAPVR